MRTATRAYDAEAQREAARRQRHDAQRDAEDKRSVEHQRQQTQATVEGLNRAANLSRKPPDDVHDLRRGRWFDEKPITANTGSAGGNMASIEEVRGSILAAIEKMNEGLGAVQQGHACAAEAQGQLMRAIEGSGQADAAEANGLLAQAVNDLETVRQQVSAAMSSAEGVANRL